MSGMRFLLILLAVVSDFQGNCELEPKPSWLKTCELKKPEFTKCSTKSVREMFEQIFSENYKIEGLDSVDPMRLEKINVLQGGGPVSVNANLSKVKIFGFSRAELIENQVSSKDYSWITTIKIPKLRLEANYQMHGQILIIPLNGRGKCWFEPTNLKVTVHSTTKLYAKYDHTFYNVTRCQVQFSMEGLRFKMSNLFQGAKTLDDSINEYLNENWKVASEALKPIISKTIEEIMLEYLQRIFHQLPGDYLVSDLPKPDELAMNFQN